MRTILDANAILRHLLDDIPSQADIVSKTIESGAETTPEIIAECVYVLMGVYEVDRKTIAETLIGFLSEVECERKQIVEFALQIFSETKLDFVDCILVATHSIKGQKILTFDKELNKFLG